MRNKLRPAIYLFLLAVFLLMNCAARRPAQIDNIYERAIGKWTVLQNFTLDPKIEKKILALDPESVSQDDIDKVLSRAPAPRIMNIHGGVYPVHLAMESFSKFLIFMGYPEKSIRDPFSGSYSYSCYESSKKSAGMISWFYEREGMRPMMVGHSQGGIQTIKILHQLAGSFGKEIPVWDPLKNTAEDRTFIIDPLTGKKQPVVGSRLSYATAVGAGGLARFLPNQWVMMKRLRDIPDSVEEFTGFYIGLDIFGGDFLGFGPANKYEPNGNAIVRNVRLPASYSHVIVPVTRHLAKNRDTRDWINSYIPSEEPVLTGEFESSTLNILWAADVWHSVKKHWVIELQNLIRAKRDHEQWKTTR